VVFEEVEVLAPVSVLCLLETERVKPLQMIQIPTLAVPDAPLGRMGRHEQSAEFHLKSVLWLVHQNEVTSRAPTT
jgi:hypothetical protein